MRNIFYKENVFNHRFLETTINEPINLPWCKPLSDIPGNNPPRNVCVLGDGSSIAGGLFKTKA